jgi:RNA polymerase sigma factor (sigma-70 family)
MSTNEQVNVVLADEVEIELIDETGAAFEPITEVTDEDLLAKYKTDVVKLAKSAARRGNVQADEIEDIEQAIRLRLVACPQEYRGNDNYVRKLMRNAAHDYLRHHCEHVSFNIRSLDEPVAEDSDAPLSALIPGVDSGEDQIAMREMVRKAWSVLTPLQQKVVAATLNFDGHRTRGPEKAALALDIPGVGRGQVRKEYRDALARMRRAISPR